MNNKTKNAKHLDSFQRVDLGLDVIHFRLEQYNSDVVQFLEGCFTIARKHFNAGTENHDPRQLEIPFPKE